jgi:DmsE family decaheme c-type cytochrome
MVVTLDAASAAPSAQSLICWHSVSVGARPRGIPVANLHVFTTHTSFPSDEERNTSRITNQEHKMPSSVKTVAGSLLAAAAALWLALPGAAQADRPPAGGAQPPAGYAGEQACLTCHKDQTKGDHARGCESCHGPGQAHVESGGDKTTIKTFKAPMSARAITAQCLECHEKGERALWEGSAHDGLNVSCVSCHSIHAPKSADGHLKAVREADTCERCHRSQVQKLGRTSHMPVKEGALECSSCHNPHGTAGVKLLKRGTTINETCERCHADKRGPYLWEHAPVVENCTTCHDAHGSTNDRMLVAKEPFLCQRCHVTSQHPPTVYDSYALTNTTVANRMSGRSCAACHQNVHGSNAPSGKAFLR